MPLELRCAMLPLPAQGWLIGVEELEVRDFWMCYSITFRGKGLGQSNSRKNHEEPKLILSRNPSFLLCLTLLNSKIF